MSNQPLPGKRAKLKKVFFRMGAITIGIGIAMLIGEIGLRLLQPARLFSSGRERDFFCRFDPELGWAPLQNITALQKKGDLSGLVHQNKYGLRGPDDMQLNKTAGKRRVLVLGDSYAWGYGVNQTELFSAPKVHGTNDEILNFGVSGYGTDQEYLFYQRDGINFVVDEVVVAFNPYNNVAHNLAPKQYGYLKPYFTSAVLIITAVSGTSCAKSDVCWAIHWNDVEAQRALQRQDRRNTDLRTCPNATAWALT